MAQDEVLAIAKEIKQQIFWSIGKWDYLSWGVTKQYAMTYQDMPTLALRVTGMVHKGWVYISLNQSMDCYEVRLLNVSRTKVKKTVEEVYCDNLGQVLDWNIEHPADMDDNTYFKKALKDSDRKWKRAS